MWLSLPVFHQLWQRQLHYWTVTPLFLIVMCRTFLRVNRSQLRFLTLAAVVDEGEVEVTVFFTDSFIYIIAVVFELFRIMIMSLPCAGLYSCRFVGIPCFFCLLTVLVAKGLGWYWFIRAGVNVYVACQSTPVFSVHLLPLYSRMPLPLSSRINILKFINFMNNLYDTGIMSYHGQCSSLDAFSRNSSAW